MRNSIVVLALVAASTGPTGEGAQTSASLALTGATLHPSPEEASIPDGVVVVRDGVIVEVGSASDVRVPEGATVIDCRGLHVVAHALDDDRGWERVARRPHEGGGHGHDSDAQALWRPGLHPVHQQKVLDYASAGGAILFGTDVGYLSDHDPADEYELMEGSGLDARRILASLTTSPAERFGEGARRGRIAPGMDADLVARSIHRAAPGPAAG